VVTKEEWLALAERCEKATGPDREIDAALHDAVYGGSEARETFRKWGCGVIWIKPRTSSLDAITALIERKLPSVTGIIPLTSGDEAWLWPKDGSPKGWRCNAATPALALCAAFCRAKAAGA
jgi:hypothetical protein